MANEGKKEVLLDTLIKVSITEALEKEMTTLPSIEELNEEYKPSQELDKRINMLIEKSYRKPKMLRFAKKFGKVAACICIVLTISSVTLLSISATRNAIFNAIIEWQKKYTEVKFGDLSTDNSIYHPTYLPKGFSESSIEKFGNIVMITYSNKAGENILFSQWVYDTGISLVDNENKNYSAIEISGEKAYLFKAQTENDSDILIWQSKGMVFELISKIDSDELKLIGGSLKK